MMEGADGEVNLEVDLLPEIIAALDNPHRLRIVEALTHGRRYVSALARDLQLSRPLLYMHLERLERAGLVTGSLELGSNGKAVKYYALEPFDLHLTPAVIAATVTAQQSLAASSNTSEGETHE